MLVDRLDEQQLDRAPAGIPRQDPRRDHARVVDDEAVARAQQIRELGKHVVFQASAGAVDHEEPRCVPRWGGRLRDQLGRQIVVELRQVHGTSVYSRKFEERHGLPETPGLHACERLSDLAQPRE